MRVIKLIAVTLIVFIVPISAFAAASKLKYKTYENTAAGYSVKYPNHWRPHEQDYDRSSVYFDYGKEQISIPDQSTAVTIGPTPIGPDLLYTSENLDEIAKATIAMIEANRFGNQDLQLRVKNTKIGKIKAKQINHRNSFVYEKNLEMVKYLFVKNGSVWTIAGPAKEKGLKQILKSLKFIQRAKSQNNAGPNSSEKKQQSPTTALSACANEIGNGAIIINGPTGPEGADRDNAFRSLTVNPENPDIVLIGTERNGFLKSTDGGATWQRFRYGLRHEGPGYPEIYDVAQSKTNPDVIYAATTDSPGPLTGNDHNTSGIYKSEDGGKTWMRKNCGVQENGGRTTAIWTDQQDFHHAIAAISADSISYYSATVKAGTYIPGGLYETRDGGENWKKINAATNDLHNGYNYIRSAKSNPSLIYTFGFSDPEYTVGFLKSTDNGETWQSFAPQFKNIHISHFDISSDGKTIYAISDTQGTPSGIWKSTDSGNTWENFALQTSGYTVTVSPKNAARVLFGQIGGLFLSTDGMQTRKQVITLEDARFTDVAFTSSNPDIVYAIAQGYILFKSIDSGETFTKIKDLRNDVLNIQE